MIIYFRNLGTYLLLFSSLAWGQFYNNQQYLIGERAAGLGGAYTAIANNSSALWYNPGGLARIKDKNLNISSTAYSYLSSNTKGALEFAPDISVDPNSKLESLDFKASDFSIISTTLIYGRKINDQSAWAFGLIVPFQDNLTQSTKGKIIREDNAIDIAVMGTKSSKFYQGMIGYGNQILKWWNVGAALKLGYFDSEVSDEIFTELDMYGGTNQYKRSSFQKEKESKSISTIGFQIGGQINLTPSFIFAGNFTFPNYVLNGTMDRESFDLSYRFTDSTASENTQHETDPYRYSTLLPYTGWEWNFGLGYLSENWVADFDWILIPPAYEKPRFIVNFKLGLETKISKNILYRVGVSTDFSQRPELIQGNSNEDRINYYSLSSNISLAKRFKISEERKTTEKIMWTSLGFNYKLGMGKTTSTRYPYTISPEENLIKDILVHNFQLLIAENISF